MIRAIVGPQRLLRPVFAALAATLIAGPAVAGSPACSAPAYRQLDFWLGNWKAYDDDGNGPYIATDAIGKTLDGCVVLEEYRQNDGHDGTGVTIYDSSRKLWHQTWVTNSGQLLIIEGVFKDGVLTMAGNNLDEAGKRVWYRIDWKQQTAGRAGVRETAFTSRDAGRSWQPAFDILFVKEPG